MSDHTLEHGHFIPTSLYPRVRQAMREMAWNSEFETRKSILEMMRVMDEAASARGGNLLTILDADAMTRNDPVNLADKMIQAGKELEGVLESLEAILELKPDNWTNRLDFPDEEIISFWNENEFRSYVDYYQDQITKRLRWGFPSFSKAHYLAAYILAEFARHEEALGQLNSGLRHEPDHPKLLTEKGVLLGKLGFETEGLKYLKRAASARPWNTVSQVASANREYAIALSNLDEFDEAKRIMGTVVELCPDDLDFQEDLIKIVQSRIDSLMLRTKRSGPLMSTGPVSLERVVWTSKKLFEPDKWDDWDFQFKFCISPDGWFCAWREPEEWHVANLEMVEFSSVKRKLLRGPLVSKDIVDEWQGWYNFEFPVGFMRKTFRPDDSLWSPCGNYLAASASDMAFTVVYSLTNKAHGLVIYEGNRGPWRLISSRFRGVGPFKWDYSSSPPIPVPTAAKKEVHAADVRLTEDRTSYNPTYDLAAIVVGGLRGVPGRVDILNSRNVGVIESHELSVPENPELQWSRDGSKLWILTGDGTASQAEFPISLLREWSGAPFGGRSQIKIENDESMYKSDSHGKPVLTREQQALLEPLRNMSVEDRREVARKLAEYQQRMAAEETNGPEVQFTGRDSVPAPPPRAGSPESGQDAILSKLLEHRRKARGRLGQTEPSLKNEPRAERRGDENVVGYEEFTRQKEKAREQLGPGVLICWLSTKTLEEISSGAPSGSIVPISGLPDLYPLAPPIFKHGDVYFHIEPRSGLRFELDEGPYCVYE